LNPEKQTVARKSARQLEGEASHGLRPLPPNASVDYYDVHGNATPRLRARLKLDLKDLNVDYVALPPKADTQIVKLKWVPSQKSKHKTKTQLKTWGVWHGAYTVRSVTQNSKVVLQECGLLADWVEDVFSPPYMQSIA
jgi:hypothetical protein